MQRPRVMVIPLLAAFCVACPERDVPERFSFVIKITEWGAPPVDVFIDGRRLEPYVVEDTYRLYEVEHIHASYEEAKATPVVVESSRDGDSLGRLEVHAGKCDEFGAREIDPHLVPLEKEVRGAAILADGTVVLGSDTECWGNGNTTFIHENCVPTCVR